MLSQILYSLQLLSDLRNLLTIILEIKHWLSFPSIENSYRHHNRFSALMVYL